jgi:hypothetical protein
LHISIANEKRSWAFKSDGCLPTQIWKKFKDNQNYLKIGKSKARQANNINTSHVYEIPRLSADRGFSRLSHGAMKAVYIQSGWDVFWLDWFFLLIVGVFF